MRIGELAKKLNVATSKIRFLEKQGLIRPIRLPSGYRDYDNGAIETLQIVLQAQSFGFTLEEINLSFIETRGQGLRCAYIIKRLTGKRYELDRHIEQLRALRTRMTSTIEELEERLAASHQTGPNKGKHQSLKVGLAFASGTGKSGRARKMGR